MCVCVCVRILVRSMKLRLRLNASPLTAAPRWPSRLRCLPRIDRPRKHRCVHHRVGNIISDRRVLCAMEITFNWVREIAYMEIFSLRYPAEDAPALSGMERKVATSEARGTRHKRSCWNPPKKEEKIKQQKQIS